MGDVREKVDHLYNAGYIRQALEKSSACMSTEEISWIMDAVGQKLRRQTKRKKEAV